MTASAPRATKEERSAAIKRMQGFLKTDQPAPTDEEVEAMLEERLSQKLYNLRGIFKDIAPGSLADELIQERRQEAQAEMDL